MPDSIDAPFIDIDPYSDETLANPFPMHVALRAAGPVARLSQYGVYVMGRYRDIFPLLKDWGTFSSAGGSGLGDIRKPGAWREPSPIVEVDPPQHTQVRTVVQRILSPALIRSWRSTFEQRAAVLVETLLEKRHFCGVHDLSEAFVADTFPTALGLRDSPNRRENLFLLGKLNFDGQGPRNARYEQTQRRADAIQDFFSESMKREALLEGGFGTKIYEAADAGEIERATAPLLIRSFLRGGLDTTASTISAALYHLAADPSQWRILREDPSKIRTAVDEAMRLETPIQNVCRQTTREVEIDGVRVENDAKILVILASANRDPERWENADAFDLNRQTMGHLGLGAGIHMCVGQMIAKLEAEALLKALAERVGRIQLDGEPTRELNNNLRSLATLPIAVERIEPVAR
jgi:cytochrome P450